MMKYTNSIIDEKLKLRNIKRIGNVVNSNSKLEFQCLLESCNYIWCADIYSVTNAGNGCPKCGTKRTIEKTKRTLNEIEEILLPRQIKLISPYINNATYSDFKCLKLECGYEWNTICRNVFNNNRGCPKCAKRLPISLDEVDSKLLSKNIKRLSIFKNTQKHMQVQCLLDNYIWNATYNKLIHNDSGCPECYGNVPLSNDIIDQRLNDSNCNIQRIGNYINIHTKIDFKCKKCLLVWASEPNNIINGLHGCPLCNKHSINEKIIYNILKKNNIEFEHQKNIKNINGNDYRSYKLDFYFPLLKIAIEYNGKQHYEPVEYFGGEEKFNIQVKRDMYVSNFCIENKIQLISIDGRNYKYKKLIKYINHEILPLLLKELND